MRYLRAGSGPPVLLIHGLLGYSFSWRFTIPALAEHFTVYAPDLLGIGFSDRVPGLDCGLQASAERLLELMRGLELDAVDVVGTSHGGAVAVLMAAVAQDRKGPSLRRLVLVAPVNPWSGAGRRRIAVLSTRMGGFLFKALLPRLDSTHDFFLRRLYADPRRIPPGTLEGYAAPLLRDGSADYLLAILRCWRSDLGRLEASYDQVKVPTLLLWGERDPAVLPKSAARLKQAICGAELVMIPDAGHLPYEELPEKFNRAVLQFLLRA